MFRVLSSFVLVVCLFAAQTPFASASLQESTVYICPMHPEVQSSTPSNCPKCDMKLVVEAPKEEPKQGGDLYTCPMHPEVRVDKAGKCAKCGMALVPAAPGIPVDFDLMLEATPAAIKPGEKVRLRFQVFNPKTGAKVKQFAVMHEQLFHLFVVSQDMSEFQHIHPALEPDGSFTIDTVLPRPGYYKIYSDFYPVEGAPQVLQRNLVTAGYKADLFGSVPHLMPDPALRKAVDGMVIDLTLDPAEPIAGKPMRLKYNLTDAKSGEPVRDLTPYLGAWGHTLILSEDQSDYVHSHPEELVPEGEGASKAKGGPEVTFEAWLPRPGNYRVWSQFQRGSTLTTVSFTIRARMLR